MNIEKWIIVHFSPTGGTKKVADAIAAGFNTPAVKRLPGIKDQLFFCNKEQE